MTIDIDFKQLNDSLEKIVLSDDEPYTLDNYLFEDKLCNMILDNTKSKIIKTIDANDIYECRSRMSLETSKQISIDFFNSINKKYGNLLKKILSDGTIIFNKVSDDLPTSYINFVHGKIYIAYYNNILDVYSICHEFMHYLDNRKEISTYTTTYSTEIFSSYIELLLRDYLFELYPQYKKDNNKMMRNSLIILYHRNLMTKIILELLKIKIDGKNISYVDVKKIIINMKKYSSGEQLDDIINDSLDNINYVDYDSSFLYTLAFAIAPYLYDCFDKKEIMSLIDVIPNYDMSMVLKYVKLVETEEENSITKESCKKLEKSYKKIIKGLW